MQWYFGWCVSTIHESWFLNNNRDVNWQLFSLNNLRFSVSCSHTIQTGRNVARGRSVSKVCFVGQGKLITVSPRCMYKIVGSLLCFS